MDLWTPSILFFAKSEAGRNLRCSRLFSSSIYIKTSDYVRSKVVVNYQLLNIKQNMLPDVSFNWTSVYLFIYLFIYLFMRRLIWVCAVCQCPSTKHSLGCTYTPLNTAHWRHSFRQTNPHCYDTRQQSHIEAAHRHSDKTIAALNNLYLNFIGQW